MSIKKAVVLLFFCFSGAQGFCEFRIIESIFLPPRFYVGDRVELRLLIETEFEPPLILEPIQQKQWLAVEDVQVSPLTEDRLQLRIFFIPFQPGVITLPVIRVGDLELDRIKINTFSVLQGESLQGLRKQLRLPGTGIKIIALVLAGLGAPFAGVFALMWAIRSFRRLQEKRKRALPYRKVVGALKKLHRDMPGLEGRVFFIRLTRCLKDYLSRRFHLPALSYTTGELTRVLGRQEPRSALERIVDVLREGDLVKFSDRQSGRKDLSRVLDETAEIIRKVEEYVEP